MEEEAEEEEEEGHMDKEEEEDQEEEEEVEQWRGSYPSNASPLGSKERCTFSSALLFSNASQT